MDMKTREKKMHYVIAVADQTGAKPLAWDRFLSAAPKPDTSEQVKQFNGSTWHILRDKGLSFLSKLVELASRHGITMHILFLKKAPDDWMTISPAANHN